jgi:hypothetical protein
MRYKGGESACSIVFSSRKKQCSDPKIVVPDSGLSGLAIPKG